MVTPHEPWLEPVTAVTVVVEGTAVVGTSVVGVVVGLVVVGTSVVGAEVGRVVVVASVGTFVDGNATECLLVGVDGEPVVGVGRLAEGLVDPVPPQALSVSASAPTKTRLFKPGSTDERPDRTANRLNGVEVVGRHRCDFFSSHRGVRNQGFVILFGCQRRPVIVCGAPATGWDDYTGTGGRARRRSSARENALAHGHSSGARSVDLPAGQTSRPGPAQCFGQHPIELPDMTEGEGPQERAQDGRCHHPVGKHRLGGSCSQ